MNEIKKDINSESYDVIAIGELLIDFMSCGSSTQDNPLFEASPGGAPGNVLAMLAKLGRKTAFIGKVGDDMFGHMLIDTLRSVGIAADNVLVDSSAGTTLAFVHNTPDGDREFSFFRNPGADTLLRSQDLNLGQIKACRILHFGTLSLTHQPSRDATIAAVTAAKDAGALISFDPNYRPLLWSSPDEAKRQFALGMSVCDVLKIAVDELQFFTGEEDSERGIKLLRREYPQIKLILLTKGADGSEGFWGKLHVSQPAFLSDNTIDTTGAGDTFLGCCLAFVLELGLDAPSPEPLREMLSFASASAYLVTTKKGALLSMPEKDEIDGLLQFTGH